MEHNPIEPVNPSGAETSQVQKKKTKKKEGGYEDVEEMAQALYIYWKSRDIARSGECDYEEANERAEFMWKNEANEKIIDEFKKAAAVQIVMLGGEYIGNKRKRQVKNEFGKNRAECNPFLLFCKDHRENVREKGSRGKGMTTLSSMWKELSEDEKQRYIGRAKVNKTKELKGEENPTDPIHKEIDENFEHGNTVDAPPTNTHTTPTTLNITEPQKSAPQSTVSTNNPITNVGIDVIGMTAMKPTHDFLQPSI
ncbi:hypothetical protein EIN_429580 [Entamoeba invadens IP1]|uniref:HMG box domain-containing protein n=1 Tax=Entamoeba invadens IP1 TaxID=370355 RepID=A0A0A1UHE5_ENTIV|nr:hypothetical protein EIN_429580 [Entamoeba invadens IP1]ELP95182.1 hypothetical protein EIN_429580 [Entamoeba invadens IP1]|eukprot:XP_004261953.1 hypothetical protein EIN_429580 [Entamoeba invadens IP1]